MPAIPNSPTSHYRRGFAALLGCTLLGLAGCNTFQSTASAPPITPATTAAKPKIGLALGGGAARGFAHIGVIKMLESQGIVADYVVGTSAGAVVGSLYAAGNDAFAMQKLALQLDESLFADWTLGGRGFLKGEALQDFINLHLHKKPLEKLKSLSPSSPPISTAASGSSSAPATAVWRCAPRPPCRVFSSRPSLPARPMWTAA